MAAASSGDFGGISEETQAVVLPRTVVPLFRRPVYSGGVDTHVERLQPNSLCRHGFGRWFVFLAFGPAVADFNLWSSDGRETALSLEGGEVLFVPPGWMVGVCWRRVLEAIILLPQPDLIARGFPASESMSPNVVKLTECFSAVRTIIDVVLDLRVFAVMPNGLSDGRVATGGAFLANLLFYAHSLLTDGKFRAPGLFARIIAAMREHLELHANRRVPVAEIAVEMGISPRQLRRIVRQETGKSPVEWVREEKARQIRRLLEEGKSIKAAVAEGGFSNASHLHRAIRRVYGCSPRAFRA